ncbi:hypothetical protein PFISCL1PPCAC_20645, partial [Pristionchus fissidentatus]
VAEKDEGVLSNDCSLLGLPNEIIEMIFAYLDFASRCKIRVNRRLRWIESTIDFEKEEGEQWDKVEITSAPTGFHLWLPNRNTPSPLSIGTFEKICKRVDFGMLIITMRFKSESHFKLIDKLKFVTASELELNDYREEDSPVLSSEKLTFLIIRDLIERFEGVEIDSVCTSLSCDDVSKLREIIRDSAYGRLRFFVTEELARQLADRFMGIHPSFFDKAHRPADPLFYVDTDYDVYRNPSRLGKLYENDENLMTSIDCYFNRVPREFKIEFEQHTDDSLDEIFENLEAI